MPPESRVPNLKRRHLPCTQYIHIYIYIYILYVAIFSGSKGSSDWTDFLLTPFFPMSSTCPVSFSLSQAIKVSTPVEERRRRSGFLLGEVDSPSSEPQQEPDPGAGAPSAESRSRRRSLVRSFAGGFWGDFGGGYGFGRKFGGFWGGFGDLWGMCGGLGGETNPNWSKRPGPGSIQRETAAWLCLASF